MPKQRLSARQPDAWRPGINMHFINRGGAYQYNQERWESESRRLNSYRPLGQKLLSRGKVDAEDIMLDEANGDNRMYDESFPIAPIFLRDQKVGETILAVAGIEQQYFSTIDLVQDVLRDSLSAPGTPDTYSDILDAVDTILNPLMQRHV